jgi:hypothetical protein
MPTKGFDFIDFTRVDVGGAFEVEVVQSATFSIAVEAGANQLDHVEVSKQGDTLRVGQKWHLFDWRPRTGRPKARITMPALKGIRLSGASRGTVSGFDSPEDFRLELSGASRLSGDLRVGSANLEASGASHVELSGSAKDLDLEASGASHLELGDFSVENADAELSGASKSTVNVNGKLGASLSGASALRWAGEPRMGDIKVSGASTLRKK